MRAAAGRLVRSPWIGCSLIVASCVALGPVLGFGAAMLALAFAEGDARGGEMLLLGVAILAGAGVGLLAGIAWAVLWLRARAVGTARD